MQLAATCLLPSSAPRVLHPSPPAGAKARRQRGVLSLLRAARESEARYLVRTLVRNLRVGSSWRSVVPALARAVTLHKEGAQATKVGRLLLCMGGQVEIGMPVQQSEASLGQPSSLFPFLAGPPGRGCCCRRRRVSRVPRPAAAGGRHGGSPRRGMARAVPHDARRSSQADARQAGGGLRRRRAAAQGRRVPG